jgi:hypothetical protein
MTLFEILSHNERIIVWSETVDQFIFTWNQSLTLQCWRYWPSAVGGWSEVDIRTLSDKPKTLDAARISAIQWANGE